MRNPPLAQRGQIDVHVTSKLVLDAGSWQLSNDHRQRATARIGPPELPMFRQITEYLELQPSPPDTYIRLADEARAAVAICIRWGSYFAAIADEGRPFAPDAKDRRVSQIADDEMARMNIEISNAISWWLTLRGTDKHRYYELVQRAMAYLPLGPKTMRRYPAGDMLRACAVAELATRLCEVLPMNETLVELARNPEMCIRAIANTITLQSWRNGPIEDVHAGGGSGYGLAERRALPRDEKAIIRQSQNGLHAGLQAVEHLEYDNAWPPSADRLLPFMNPFICPTGWSYSEESRAIRLPLRPGGLR
jgi:hypothetical protein